MEEEDGRMTGGRAPAIGGEERLLEDVLKDALAQGHEVEPDGGGVGGQQGAEILEVLAGEEAGWRQEGDEAAGRPGEVDGEVHEQAIAVGVAVEAAAEDAAQLGGERHPAEGRVGDDEIEGLVAGPDAEAVANVDESGRSGAGLAQQGQDASFEEDLAKPGGEGIDLEAAEARGESMQDLGGGAVGERSPQPLRGGQKEGARAGGGVEDAGGGPVEAGGFGLIEQALGEERRGVIDAAARPPVVGQERRIEKAQMVSGLGNREGGGRGAEGGGRGGEGLGDGLCPVRRRKERQGGGGGRGLFPIGADGVRGDGLGEGDVGPASRGVGLGAKGGS